MQVSPADVSTNTIEKIVKKMVGQGIKVSNITFSGKNINMVGSFSDYSKSVGFSEGVILTNEKAIHAQAPNTARNVQNTVFEARTDADLNSVFGTNFQDVALIAFDFVAATDSITVSYQFASEEYNEFISTYTDGMAIMLSGPGIVGKKNIATLPNGTPIAVNAIHAGFSNISNAEFYWQNPKNDFCNNCEYFVFNAANSNTTEYDGFTTILTAKAKIQPCETYHLKIVVGDANDSNIDSGIFIESKNFKSTYLKSTKKPEIDTVSICLNDIRPLLSITSNMTNMQWFYNQTFTGNTTASYTTSLAGWYTVATTVPQGCSFRDSVYLKVSNEFILNASNDTLACNFNPITLTSNVSIPDNYRYKWLPNNELTSKIKVLTVGKSTQIYTVTATNFGGCTKNAFVTVSISPNFYTIIPTASQNKICLQNNVLLTAGLISTDPFTIPTTLPSEIIYNWKSNKIYPNKSEITWNTTTIGANVVTITAISPEGCKLVSTITITGNQQPIVLKTSKDSLCFGGVVQLNVTTTGAFSRIWSENNATTTSLVLTPSGSAFYVVTAFSNFYAPNCVAKDSIFVKVNPLPSYTKSSDTTICEGENVRIWVESNFNRFSWLDSIGVQNNSIIKPKQSVSYAFVLTTQKGCISKEDKINIIVNPIPFIRLKKDTTICEGTKIALNITTFSGSFSWIFPVEIEKNIEINRLITPNSSEKYIAKTTNQFGCNAMDTMYVFVNKNPVLPLITASKTTFCELSEDFVILSSKPNLNYLWSTKELTSNILVKSENRYVLTVTDSNLCKTTDSIYIVRNCEGIYIFPNVITPNNDNFNDSFVILGNETTSSLKIYNRYGVEIYQSENYQNNWNAENQPDGLYFYIFKSTKEHKGWIKVLR